MKLAFPPAAVLAMILSGGVAVATVEAQEYKYIGVEACGKCHKTAKIGNQLAVWEQSKHSKAYATLQTPQADSIALATGLATKAAESETCLGCHTTAGPDAGVKPDEGIGCERCHNPGSGYKGLSVMKDRAKSIEAGMRDMGSPETIETMCRTCHNEKSPSFKAFNFAERWEEIKHLRPTAP